MKPSYIVDAVRTPRGRGRAGKGALTGVHPQELFAHVLRAIVERGNGISPELIDDVIVGCVSQVGEQGANLARNAVLTAGLPLGIPGVTLNRFCSSGLQAVNFAAMAVASGAQDLVLAGGVESMSRVPMGSDGGGTDGNNPILQKRVVQVPQGISADLIATLEGFSREEIDAIAVRSQQRAARAIEDKRFDGSLVPVIDPTTGALLLERDESPRADTTAATLAELAPSFVKLGAMKVGPQGETLDELAERAHPQKGAVQHFHTAGNSSGLADGAAVVALASEKWVREHGGKARARILSTAVVGSDPVLMLTAPAPASEKALRLAGMNVKDIDLWEVNEAFAAVVLQTERALGLDPERVNINGGAIALGHPLGATGAMLLGTVLDELERSNKTTALVTLCIGGGQGIATIIERV